MLSSYAVICFHLHTLHVTCFNAKLNNVADAFPRLISLFIDKLCVIVLDLVFLIDILIIILNLASTFSSSSTDIPFFDWIESLLQYMNRNSIFTPYSCDFPIMCCVNEIYCGSALRQTTLLLTPRISLFTYRPYLNYAVMI